MNNLLGSLDGWTDEPDSDDEDPAPGYDDDDDVESNRKIADTPKINYMEHFFREIDNIKADIDAVGQATKAIRDLHEQALSATTNAEEDALSQQLKPLINATNQRAKRTKTLLGLLKQETDKLREENTLNASDLRIRENLNTTITRKFVDEMKLYQSAQQEYKNALKTKAKRQIVAIKPDATEEEVDQVMRTEGGREALMKQAVLSNSVNDQIQTTYNKVAGKYQDVLTLEQSVAELHQMFLDFALLYVLFQIHPFHIENLMPRSNSSFFSNHRTEQQGELLDQIEFQVREANDHVEYANEETVKAIEYQSAIRKKQWYVALTSGREIQEE